jgi:uncharacterized protein
LYFWLVENKIMEELIPDKDQLIKLLEMKMPFGKYKGRYIIDLPEPYLVWFRQKGFPAGKLGELLALAYEIKLNGLEGMVKAIRRY